MAKQLKLGLDLKGGVHLVLRVKTDDALRLRPNRIRRGCARNCPRRRFPPPSRRPTPPTSVWKACRRRRTRRSARPRPTSSRLRPQGRQQRHLHVRHEAEHPSDPAGRSGHSGATDDRAARQRTGRHRAEHRAAGTERRSDPRAVPGVTDVDRAKEIIRSTGLLELKIVEQGPAATREALVNGQDPAGMEIIPGSSSPATRAAGTVYYLVRRRPRYRKRSAKRAADDRRKQSAGGQLHAEQRRRGRFGESDGREHRPAAGDRPRRAGAVGAADRIADRHRRTDHRQLHPGGSPEPVADLTIGCAAGIARLPRRADDRPDASAPTRFARGSSRLSSGFCSSSGSCSSTTGCRA